ncbi:hypothetical protein LJC56_02665 [Christensenellaceae bacterium OttesenSCG-928-K19]|nr:hypothetical protein [Christensenellaceae bacterium OttesenSCG-928-K19]
MSDVFDVLVIVLPVVAALFLGYLSKRKQLLKPSGIDGLKALVMNFTLPATLFGAFYNTEFNLHITLIVLVIFGCSIAGLLLGKLLLKIFSKQHSLLPFITTGFEAGMMGYGFYIMLFSQQQVSNFAIVDIGQVIFVFTIYMALLNARKGISRQETIVAMFKSPVLISIIGGIIIGVTGLGAMIDRSPVGETVASIFNYISAPTGMLMIFVVGYGLELSANGFRRAMGAVVSRIAIMAVLCILALFIIGLIMPLTYHLYWAIILMFTLPAPYVLPIFSDDQKDSAYISTSLSLYTIVSVALFAVIAILK